MGYYPVFLDLRGRPCTVICADWSREVEDKVRGLLAAGAAVTAIGSHPSPYLEELAAGGRIALRRRAYDEGDLVGAFLAIAATTEDQETSGRIAAEAQRERVLLNVVDVTPLCTWIAPALVRRGDLTVAVSTNGISPAMARFVKERLESDLPEAYGMLLAILGEVRQELRRRRVRPTPEAWQGAVDARTLGLLAAHDWDGVQTRLLELLDRPRQASG